jgi:hypothetical protein
MRYSCVDVNSSDRVYAGLLRNNFVITNARNHCLGLSDNVYRHTVDTLTSPRHPGSLATVEMYDIVFDAENGKSKYHKTRIIVSAQLSLKLSLDHIIRSALKNKS